MYRDCQQIQSTNGNLEHKILMTKARNHQILECYSTGSDILIMLNFKCLLSPE